MQFRSPELYKELRDLHRARATGYLSVAHIQGAKPTYGMLKLVKGEVTHVEYGSKRSVEALDDISGLRNPIVSFGNGGVFEAPDRNLPSTPRLLGERLTVSRTGVGARTGASGARSGVRGLLGTDVRRKSEAEATNGLNIFTQVLLTMLVVSLVPVAGQWYINNARVRQDLANSTQGTLLGIAGALDNQIDAWLGINLASLDAQTALPEIRAMEDAALQAPILARLNNASDQIYTAFTVTSEGSSVGNTQKSYRNRSFFRDIVAGEPVGAQVFYGQVGTDSLSAPKQLTLARPVEGFSGNLAGLIALNTNLETVSAYVRDSTFGESGYAVLVDADGNVIAHGRPERLEEGSSLDIISEATATPAILADFIDGDVRSVALKQETQLGWTIYAVQSYREAFSTLITAQRFAWILLVITVLLALLLAYLLARRVVAPIEALTRSADAISLGKLETPVDAKNRGDEIGSLARAIERLRLTVKIAFQKMRE